MSQVTKNHIPSKEILLAQLQAERQALLSTLEDMPDEVLTISGVVGQWSALDVLAWVTAWDGEALRRIAFATGQTARQPHDVDDEAYWSAWGEEQIKMKRVMGPTGVKVDLAGTWVRLLARIESLSPLDYARWVEIDSHLRPGRDREFAEHLQRWREQWERSLPWWLRLKRRLVKWWRTRFTDHHQ